ncbi:uncharacterized protein TRIADDRAFT_51816 [Trichoplax adhaerens]|uniref:Suppressor of white apricot N-terminal domain-containing protein n=1 Tax=Trichoplax adhaerens TaxID=10228 RepID=B3RKY9_TRIAD|nr:hypothetical protein TRIADDRAFT_51816 [Trichoplax adhaerens]EDV28668.1 hypothetical protein TRIADDRAFT_51816 [Trichoplax adhaerens]|eukprot:XP_002107870.1 hypothetical protein TRIADDRAFT_51816 [Trichoplax adhaerens]
MWHEARKHEKKLRGMMVDWKKRAERRRQYYESLASDPFQQLRIVGVAAKIHINVVESSDSMMQWRGQPDILIDRFDARAHLDYLPNFESDNEDNKQTYDDLQLNYERYKILAKSDFLGVSEDMVLQQIELEEDIPLSVRKVSAASEAEKEKLSEKAATINYQYAEKADENTKNSDIDDIDEDEFLLQPSSEGNVDPDQLNEGQRDKLNLAASSYGIGSGTFCRFIREDILDLTARDKAQKEEAERLVKYGRRAIRHDHLGRSESNLRQAHSPPSYARRSSPTYEPYKRSVSGSESSEGSGDEIKFITEFSSAGATKADGNKKSANCREQLSSSSRHRERKRSREYSTDRYKDRYHSRNSSKDRRRNYKSRSRSYDRESRRKHSRYSRSRSSEKRSRRRHRDGSSSAESSRYKKYKQRARSRSSDRHRRSDSRDRRSNRRDSRSLSPRKSPPVNAIKPIKKTLTPGKDTEKVILTHYMAMVQKTLSRQEMLKLKMQRALNKHLKHDHKLEKERQEKKELERAVLLLFTTKFYSTSNVSLKIVLDLC